MKKLLSAAMSMLLAVGMLAGCGQPAASPTVAPDGGGADAGNKIITVGYAQVGAESDWRTANTASFKSTFTEANGFKLIFDDANQQQENQIKAIRSFIQQEVDYIVLAPTTETGWDVVLGEAKAAGIPVILSDRLVQVSDDTLYTAWVGGNFLQEGRDSITWLENYLAKQGRSDDELTMVHLQGTIGASAQIGRTEGINEGFAKHSNWKLVGQQTGEFTQSVGQEVMESFLKANPDIDVVFAENDNMAFGAIDALKAVGKKPGTDVIIVSFDAVKAAFESMIAGDMNVSVECNPLHGPRVAEIIQQLEAGQTPDKIQYVVEGVYDQDNAATELPNRLY